MVDNLQQCAGIYEVLTDNNKFFILHFVSFENLSVTAVNDTGNNVKTFGNAVLSESENDMTVIGTQQNCIRRQTVPLSGFKNNIYIAEI